MSAPAHAVASLPRYLDTETWPRRATFELFSGFDKPFFSVCTRLDVSALMAARPRLGRHGLTLAYHHAALQAANELEPFRYRIEDQRVRVYEVIHASSAVLQPDESIGFVYMDYFADFTEFAAAAAPRLEAGQRGELVFDAGLELAATMHFTTLPWFDFSSFSHARDWKCKDSMPKIAFGRIVDDGQRSSMAMAVEVHHALMDGLHVGRFVARVQQLLDAYAGS